MAIDLEISQQPDNEVLATSPNRKSIKFKLAAVGAALALVSGCSSSDESGVSLPDFSSDSSSESSGDLAESNQSATDLMALQDNPANLFLQAYPNDANASRFSFIAQQPTARWLYKGGDEMLQTESETIEAANSQQKIPAIITYVESGRDCGSNSAGGIDSEAAYQSFIDQSAQIQGNAKVINIIEPDGAPKIVLPGQSYESCMPADLQSINAREITYAASKYKQNPNSKVYIDAGSPGFRTAEEMAEVLKSLGIENYDGYSIGVSAYITDQQLDEYAQAINSVLGYSAHYVADTSRNGIQWDGYYCNPDSSKIASGKVPSLQTSYPLRDANLWINLEGGSDGDGPGCTTDNTTQGWATSNDPQTRLICPPIGPAGSWNPCVANTIQGNADRLQTN